jgi:hypothetical protein
MVGGKMAASKALPVSVQAYARALELPEAQKKADL